MARVLQGRFPAWLMVAALLPSLLYVGHWSFEVPLPGDTVAVVGVDESGGRSHESDGHGEHCHGESSCSDVQPLGLTGLAVMGRTLALLGVAGVMLALAVAAWRPANGTVVGPERRPPRGRFSIAA